MTGNGMFSTIDNSIVEINEIKSFLDAKFADLEKMAQEQIDEYIVNNINPEINSQLSELRANIISTLQSMYSGYLSLTEKIQPIVDTEPTNLSSVITFCTKVKDFITSMYSEVLLFMTELTLKLAELTTAITSLVNYTPPISGINFDKLDIQMDPITMADITGGDDS